MAHVLVLSLVFPPDAVSTAQIMGDLVQDLRTVGHTVSVITTTPHYNRDADAEARQPLRPWWGRVVQRSDHHGTPVFHTLMPAKSGSVPLRLAAWMLFHLLSLLVGTVAVRRVEVIITPSPPLTMGVVAWLLGGWHRAPFIYNVQELYPDIAINLGAVRNRAAIRLLYALERFVYARSARVTLIAERMRRRLIDKGVPSDRITVIPNFVDMDVLHAVPSPNGFSREADIDSRFVVCYAGNLGPAQGLETLLDAARLLADEPGIVLVLVGGGTLWDYLASRIGDERLTNVRLMKHQPFSRVPEIYGASHLSVVSQAVSTGSDAVPSKVYRIMACGGAVLAATEPQSDLAQLITAGQCGFIVPQDSPPAIAAVIRQAYRARETLASMGQSGREHVLAYYSRPVVTARYDSLIHEIMQEYAA
jgi:colanic acid biosynthesis glycosyl transferase WcaI